MSAQEDTHVPNNLEEHDNYIVVNPKHLKSFKLNTDNNSLRAGVGLLCSEVNQLLEEQGYRPLFDDELQDKYLFEVINYNLPLGNETLASRLITMELVSGEGKLIQSSP